MYTVFNNVNDVITFVNTIPEDQIIFGSLRQLNGKMCVDGHINTAMTGNYQYGKEYDEFIAMLKIEHFTLSTVNNEAPQGKRKEHIINFLNTLNQ